MTTLYESLRLSDYEIKILKHSIISKDQNARVYLFGSRTDIDKKGGDIDILVLSNNIDRVGIRDVRLEFFKHFGEQKLDIVLDKHLLTKPFTKIILKEAVEL